ncbi:MAG: ATP-binding protein [Treponema sp.]|jgi:predicted AAA+ superfamily ATPase|nr:ATP-binding protein [Treponema sp.]
MDYIPRYLEDKFLRISGFFKAVLLTGQRQAGKTTMLKHLAEGQNRKYISLDNMADRNLAKTDPAYFLQIHKPPVLIDEIQFAPELFPPIKVICDSSKKNGLFWLTGSQRYDMMKCIRESLAGRIGLLELHGFSRNELSGARFSGPLLFDYESLKEREARSFPADPAELFNFIWQGGMPRLAAAAVSGGLTPEERNAYFHSYTETYLLRDAVELGGIRDTFKFVKFCEACAAETSHLVNYKNLAEAAEISLPTAKEWFSLLRGLGILFVLPPYSNNRLKRLVKTPKFYFYDTGLCAFLAKWPSPETLMTGAASGAYFENMVVSEIVKSYGVSAFEPALYYYRDTNQRELDLIVESGEAVHPLEIKKAALPNDREVQKFSLLKTAKVLPGPGGIICCCDKVSPIDRNNCRIPAWII